MGLFNKIKNILFEEEEIEVPIKETKKVEKEKIEISEHKQDTKSTFSFWMVESKTLTKESAIKSSESIKTIKSPLDWAYPSILAFDTPSFFLWITLNRESFIAYSSQIFPLSSVLPSSTNIASKSG